MPEGMAETHKNMEEGNLMKLRKATALGLASMMTVSALAVPAAAGEAKQYQTDTLQVAIWDNNQLAGLQQIADEWSEKSGVKVNIDVITWNEYWTLLEAGASGGTLPDVFWMHINEAQKYMEAEMLLNLNDYIAQDEAIDLANYYEGIVNIYNNDGNQYALPKDHDTIALIYNKAVFDKYGVEYPTNDWNWDDYCAAAAAITQAGKDDGVYGTAMNTNDGQDGWYNFIYDFGGKLISDDNKTSGMDDEKTIAAMTYLADNLFPSMPDQNLMAVTDPDVMFLSGIVGMMLQGSWMVNTFYTAENSADYAWAEIPYYDANGNGTLIQHPASRYTTAWEGGFTTGLVEGWQNPEKMADVCRAMADMMNEVLASE